MQELFLNAWAGWGDYIQYGKLAVLLLAMLLFLWFCKKGSSQKAFVLYATVMAVLCICPVTAVVLMCYQTRFYDYEWIWSAVPVTAVTAFGVTLLWDALWEGAKDRRKRFECIVVAVMLAVVLLLGGGLGSGQWDGRGQQEERENAYGVVEGILELGGEQEICLWAPAEILEYAREANGGICLLYGRNMWDAHLNAYSYDVYEEWKQTLYEWMEQVDEPLDNNGDLGWADAAEYAQLAKDAGVNCVLLPAETATEIVQKVAEVFGATPQQIEEYWVIYE